MKDESVAERSARLLAPVRATLSRFEQEADTPVLAGPWLGEVGFELLYWIPFLRWAVSEFPGLRRQLVIQSRGGVASWYEGLATRYVDLFDHFSLQTDTYGNSGAASANSLSNKRTPTMATRPDARST